MERCFPGLQREDVRVAAHQLVGDAFQGVGDRKAPGLRFELRQKDGLEHEVAELLAERRMIVAIDRLEHLVGFFEHERLERVDRLLAVPGTPLGRPESRDDFKKAVKLFHLVIG